MTTQRSEPGVGLVGRPLGRSGETEPGSGNYTPHGPAGPSEWIPGRGHVAKCVCGRVFSSWTWHHVPALYDHLAEGRTL